MKKLMIVALVAVALTGCGTEVNCPESLPVLEAGQVAGFVPMPAPPAPRPPAPAPRPAPPRPAAPKAPQQQAPRPAAPKPQVQRPAPKPYKPLPIYRPVDRNRSFDRTSPNYNYRTVYVNHGVDHTPLLWMIAMNGMMSNSHPAPVECR
jgi:hypothetical protein